MGLGMPLVGLLILSNAGKACVLRLYNSRVFSRLSFNRLCRFVAPRRSLASLHVFNMQFIASCPYREKEVFNAIS